MMINLPVVEDNYSRSQYCTVGLKNNVSRKLFMYENKSILPKTKLSPTSWLHGLRLPAWDPPAGSCLPGGKKFLIEFWPVYGTGANPAL